MSRSLRFLSACALSLTLVAACGGGDEEAGDESTTTSTTEGAEQSTTTTTEGEDATTSTTTNNSGSEQTPEEIAEAMRELLLEVDEIGVPGAEEVDYVYEEGENPCGNDTDAEAPFVAIAGRSVAAPDRQLGFLQEIRLYATESEAADAFDLGVANLDCGTTEDGLTIAEPVDITDEVGGDRAVGIGIESEQVDGALFVVHYSDVVVLFQFSSGADAATDDLPSPVDIASAGVEKIIDLIG